MKWLSIFLMLAALLLAQASVIADTKRSNLDLPSVKKNVIAVKKLPDALTATGSATIIGSARSTDQQKQQNRPVVEAKSSKNRETDGIKFFILPICFLGFFMVIVIGCEINMKITDYRRRMEFLDNFIKHHERSLEIALASYLEFVEDAHYLPKLSKTTGLTKEIFNHTSEDIEIMRATICGMRDRIEQIKALKNKARFWHDKPLEDAVDMNGACFEFNTNTPQSEPPLFVSPAKTIRIDPFAFSYDVAERYERSIGNWRALQQAVESSEQSAEVLFPYSGFEEMCRIAQENGISHQWLASHPLYGDQAANQSLYAQVNEGRVEDPISYMARIHDLRQKEKAVKGLLDRLIVALNEAKAARLEMTPASLDQTVLTAKDDPEITCSKAMRYEAYLTSLLETGGPIEEAELLSRAIMSCYRKAMGQAEEAEAAIGEAETTIAAIKMQMQKISEQVNPAKERSTQLEQMHKNVDCAITAIANAERAIESGRAELEEAQNKLRLRRHLEALTNARNAQEQFDLAVNELSDSIRYCNMLDQPAKQLAEPGSE